MPKLWADRQVQIPDPAAHIGPYLPYPTSARAQYRLNAGFDEANGSEHNVTGNAGRMLAALGALGYGTSDQNVQRPWQKWKRRAAVT